MARWLWWVALALCACAEVSPSNPFDPQAPAAQQAPGGVVGTVVLPEGFSVARLDGGAAVLEALADGATTRQPLSGQTGDASTARAPFDFGGLPPGDYRIHIEVPGFEAMTERVTVSIGQVSRLGELQVIPQAASQAITGAVELAGGGELGHGGSLVEVQGTTYLAVSASDGAFRVAVPPGTYTLRFSHAGHEPEERAGITVGAGADATLGSAVVLTGAPGSLRGRVVFPVGFSGAQVFDEVSVAVWTADAAADAEPVAVVDRVGATGDFSVEALPAGRYRVQPRAEGFGAQIAVATLAPGERLDLGALPLVVVAGGEGLLTGVAERAGAAAHSGIRVQAIGTPFVTTTGPDGAYALIVTPGRHTLQFSQPGYGTEELSAPDVQGGGQAMVDPVRLVGQPASVRGLVQVDPDFDGRAVLPDVAVRVLAFDADDGLRQVAVAAPVPSADAADTGAFQFGMLPAGDYQIEVSHPQFLSARRAVNLAPGEDHSAGVFFLSPTSAEAVLAGSARRDCAECDHGGIRVEAVGTPFVTFTGETGDWQLSVAEGAYRLRFSARGYGVHADGPFEAQAGAVTRVPDVVLAGQPARLRATVDRVAGDGTLPAAVGALATVQDAAGEAVAVGQIGADGALQLAVDTAGGAHTLRLDLDRHAPAAVPIQLEPGRVTDLGRLRLDLLRGAVLGEAQAEALPHGASVSVVLSGAPEDEVTRGLRVLGAPPPGLAGFAFDDVPAGRWVVTAVAPGHRAAEPQALLVEAGAAAEVALALPVRQHDVTAPAVVSGDELALAATGDDDLTWGRAWIGDGNVGDTPFEALAEQRWTTTLPPGEGAYLVWTQLANEAARNGDPADDVLAYVSPAIAVPVIRDDTPPDHLSLAVPAFSSVPNLVAQVDCRDALAGADDLSVEIRAAGAVLYLGPYRPEVVLAVAGDDGPTPLTAVCRDWAGLESEPWEGQVVLDRQGPTVDRFVVGPGGDNAPVADRTVDVAVATSDAWSGVAGAAVSGDPGMDCAQALYTAPTNGTFTFTMAEGEGPRQLFLCVRDGAGNVTGPVASNPVLLDTLPPVQGRLSLGDGAVWTNTAEVALEVAVDEPGLWLELSGDVDGLMAPPGEWPAVVELTGADGPKLVSARLIDAAGNASPPFTDTVSLDREAPADGTVVLADGRAVVNDRSVPVSVADTAPDQMRFWEVPAGAECQASPCGELFSPFSPASTVTLSEGEGGKRVCWQFCDLAGNASTPGGQAIELGTYVPRPRPELSALEADLVAAFVPRTFTIQGRGVSGDTVALIGDFEAPCLDGPAACAADPDGGCALEGQCAETCADQCTVDIPEIVLRNAGTYPVRLQTPAPVAGGAGTSAEAAFLSVVAPLPTITDVAPRGVIGADATGDVPATVTLEIEGFGFMNNVQFRLGRTPGEVLGSAAIDIEGAPDSLPMERVQVRFSTAQLPGAVEGGTVDVVAVNPSPGGGEWDWPLGWNPALAPCDLFEDCRGALSRTRAPLDNGLGVAQGYIIEGETTTGVLWAGGDRLQMRTMAGALAASVVPGLPFEAIPRPVRPTDQFTVAEHTGRGSATLLATARWRSSGEFGETVEYQMDEDVPVAATSALLDGDPWPDLVMVSRSSSGADTGRLHVLLGGPDAIDGRFRTTQRLVWGGGRPTAVQVLDYDGDGLQDVAVAGGATLSLLKGLGDGTFQAPTVFRLPGFDFSDLAVADIDGDGRADAVAANAGLVGGVMVVGISPGGRPRGRLTPGLVNRPARAVATADVDGDGVEDVLLAEAGVPAVVAYLNDGGTLLRGSSAALNAAPVSLDAGDLDADGDPDAVVLTTAGEVRVILNAEGGALADRRGYAAPTSNGRAGVHVALADLDGDARLDLMVGGPPSWLGPLAQWRRGDDNLVFGGARELDVLQRPSAAPASRWALTDLDLDGRPDVVGWFESRPAFNILRGAGGRSMGVKYRIPTRAAGGGALHSRMADLDGDGVDDLLVKNNVSLSAFRVSDQALEAMSSYSLGADFRFVDGAPWVGDYDGDGDTDVVFVRECVAEACRGQRDVRYLRGLGTGRFAQAVSLSAPSPLLSAVTVGQIVAGERPAVISLWQTDEVRPSIRWRRRLANGQLQDEERVNIAHDPRTPAAIEVADLDGDGVDELAYTTAADEVRVLRWTGVSFRLVSLLEVAASKLRFGHLDGDGLLDLVAVAQAADPQPGVTVFWGEAGGGIDEAGVRPGSFEEDADVGDLDGDGVDDLVSVRSQPEDRLGIIMSLGDRTFMPQHGVPVSDSPVSVGLGDLDGDGILDVVTGSSLLDRLVVWQRPGPARIFQTFEDLARGPTVVAPGARATFTFTQEKQLLKRVGLSARLSTAGAELGAVEVQLTAPDGSTVDVGRGPAAARWPLNESGALFGGFIGWQPSGPWTVTVINGGGQPLTVDRVQVHTTGRFVSRLGGGG